MMKIFMVLLGGGLGSVARYLLSGFSYRFSSGVFPVGTMVANLLGCFVIGFLWAMSEKFVISPNVKIFLFIGILGGFTTFSSFGLETFSLFRDGQMRLALLNILVSNVLGIAFVFVGFALGRVLFK